MKIVQALVYTVQIPFKQSFKHHLATREMAENVVVCLKSDAGEVGYGESVPREYVTGESIHSVVTSLQNYWIPSLWEPEWGSPSQAQTFIKEWNVQILDKFKIDDSQMLAARCAVELALLDLLGKHFKMNALKLLGYNFNANPLYYSGVISGDSLKKARKKAWLMKLYGFKQVKVKVGTPNDVELIRSIRSILGKGRDIRVDANGAWTKKEALKQIEALQKWGISAVEQPVEKSDLEGLQYVTEKSSVSVIADESYCSLKDARVLFEIKGCDILNIRISKCGGLYYSLLAAELAEKNHFGIQLGCQVGETAILSSAGRLFAQAKPEIKYLEGSYELFLLRRDISHNRVCFSFKGKAKPILEFGLGVEIDTQLLEQFAVNKVVLTPKSQIKTR